MAEQQSDAILETSAILLPIKTEHPNEALNQHPIGHAEERARERQAMKKRWKFAVPNVVAMAFKAAQRELFAPAIGWAAVARSTIGSSQAASPEGSNHAGLASLTAGAG